MENIVNMGRHRAENALMKVSSRNQQYHAWSWNPDLLWKNNYSPFSSIQLSGLNMIMIVIGQKKSGVTNVTRQGYLKNWFGIPHWGPLAPTPPQATLRQTHTQQWRAEGATSEIWKSQKHFCQTSLNGHQNLSGWFENSPAINIKHNGWPEILGFLL